MQFRPTTIVRKEISPTFPGPLRILKRLQMLVYMQQRSLTPISTDLFCEGHRSNCFLFYFMSRVGSGREHRDGSN